MPSGLVAPEIPPTQNPLAPFLSAFYASAAINAKRRKLEEEVQMMALREHQMQNNAQFKEMQFGLNLQAEQRKSERAADLYYLGQKGIEIREQGVKLAADKAAAEVQDKQEKLRRDALGLFTKQRLTYRGSRGATLPADAFENPDIIKDDLSSPGWHTDPKKPGKRFFNAPVFNPQTGQPLADQNQKPIVDPITIDNDTFGHLKGMYDATKRDMPTSRTVTPDPTPTLKDRAKSALDDPDATPAEKAAAQKILGTNG